MLKPCSPIQTQTVADARATCDVGNMFAGELIPVAATKDVLIPVFGGAIGARVYTPEGLGPHPIVVFYHGGGWVIGSLTSHDNVARNICRDAAAIVVAVDYRMGPEYRFPTAAHDAFIALQWVASNASDLGGDPSRLAVCGDSAGGNLSAVVSQLARESGPKISFAALVYPAVDFTDRAGSMIENAHGYFLDEPAIEWFVAQYVAEGDYTQPLASPALNPDLSGLPPCFITTCEFDPLRDQAERYGTQLLAAGVAAEIKRYDGLIHASFGMAGILAGGREMMVDVCGRLHAALHTSS
jgi:acetyl esterase